MNTEANESMEASKDMVTRESMAARRSMETNVNMVTTGGTVGKMDTEIRTNMVARESMVDRVNTETNSNMVVKVDTATMAQVAKAPLLLLSNMPLPKALHISHQPTSRLCLKAGRPYLTRTINAGTISSRRRVALSGRRQAMLHLPPWKVIRAPTREAMARLQDMVPAQPPMVRDMVAMGLLRDLRDMTPALMLAMEMKRAQRKRKARNLVQGVFSSVQPEVLPQVPWGALSYITP